MRFLKSSLAWLISACMASGAVALPQYDGVSELEVSAHGGYYRLHTVLHSRFDRKTLWRFIDDFSQLPRINGAVKSVRSLPAYFSGIRRVRLKTRACVWFFCKTLHHVQDLVYTDRFSVLAIIVPGMSDYKAGWALWRLTANPAGSTLTIDLVLVPDFWIPPLIGPYLIKRKLRSEARETLQGLERLAAKTRHKDRPR